MIISRIIQNGLDLSIETNDIPFQYSSNLHMKFVKDDAYKDWTLEGYYALPKTNLVESKEYQLKINSDGTFKLDEKFFAKAGTIQFSFKLVETDSSGANVHLGIVKYLVRNSIGDTSTVLPEDKELWYTLVQQEVKKYFETNYSEKLNDFNTKYDDTITKYNEIVETSTEVKKEYDEVASMKKSVDSSKQSIDNTKKQIDSTYDEYKKFANETKIEINNAKQAIINGKNEINTLAKEKVDEYTQKVTDFNNNYNTKTESLDTKINEIQTNANEIVETSTEQLKENIAESKNDAIKQIQSEGQSYQDQINKLQKSEALQDEAINKLKDDVDLKVTQPYINNNDSTHITSSDNGLMSDLVIKGNTVQESTKGLNLLDFNNINTTTMYGITLTNNGDGSFSATGQATSTFNVESNNFRVEDGDYKLIDYAEGIYPTIEPNASRLQIYSSDTNSGLATLNKYSSEQVGTGHLIGNDYYRFRFRFITGETYDLIYKPMFYQNGDGTYEPYTGGKPSPNPDYPQEVKGVDKIEGKVVGKNLFDISKIKEISNAIKRNDDGSLTITSTSLDSSVNTKMPLKDLADLEVGKTYIISFITTGKEQIYLNDVKQYWTSNSVLTITQDILNSHVRLYPKNVSSTDIVSGIQIEEASTATNYQPYQSQSFNYTLSKPLYRLSDSVYDYVDLNKDKIVRNVGIIEFDGSSDENWLQYNGADAKLKVFYSKPLNNKLKDPTKNEILLSNKLIYRYGCWGTDLEYTFSDNHSNHFIYITTPMDISNSNVFKQWLTQNPITVYYQLETPTEEDIPEELLTQLQSLKSYYPQTNIMFDTEVEPYINFDYKLNLKSWIEDKDNKEIIYDKQNKEKDKYSSTFFENMFALQRTGDIYTVKFPKWGTSHVSTGEKLDANAGLVCEPSTKTIKGQNDYANIPLFKTYDVNAYVDDDGVRHVTAIKSDKDFKDEGKVDVFVLGMSYYEKVWEDDQYWYYSRTDMPRDGYTVARECINRDGSIQPFALYSKYVCGDIDGLLYSSKGLMPSKQTSSTAQLGTLNANNSYNGMIPAFQKRGKFYSGGMTCDYKYILTTFYLKYATLNSQSIMTGCVNYSFQYVASIQSEDKSTYFPLTKTQANVIEVGSYVSVGYTHINKSTDRYYQNMHMYANDVKVLRKEAIDDNNVAIYLDVKEPFNTMPVTVADGVISDVYISSMHWRSGFSDDVLDRDGCPCEIKTQLVNGKFPMVIQGIEIMVGGYETYANAFMDIVDATGKREVYIQNDASLLTTNMTTAKTTYKKSPYAIQPTKLNSWNYITRIDFDLENGTFVQTNIGQDGSSTTTGFADGVYIDNASSGQREFLGFGYLWTGSSAGLSFLLANSGVGSALWSILARLSINGVGGELTA